MTAVLNATRPAASRGRAPRVPLDELAGECARCAHQNGGHTGGAARYGWAPFDPVWAAATGWCTVPGCDCPARTNDSAVRSAPAAAEAPVVVTPPPPIVTRLTGPCGHGTGPCGATPTRPYACGARCVACTPAAFEAAGGCPCTAPPQASRDFSVMGRKGPGLVPESQDCLFEVVA